MPMKAPPLQPVAAPRNRRTTMTDVATAAGVSQTTVSLVLNPHSGAKLSEATRNRVLDAVARLGYRSTRQAAPAPARPGGGRNLIVYLADELSTTQHPAVNIDGAREAAWNHNCLLAVYATRGDEALELATLQATLANPSVLGIIYATISTREVELPHGFGELPAVLLNCYDAERRYPSVVPAEVAGGHVGTEHLLARGHRRIGFINGEPWMDAARDRLKGYRQALATADLPFDPRLVRDGDWMVDTGRAHALSLLAEPAPPTALFCANDLMAIGAIDAVRSLGLRVPEDVSVLGYDDQEVARHMDPPLSTMVLPNFELGQTAVDLLVQRAASMAAPAERQRMLKVECPLVERSSVAAPAGAAGAPRGVPAKRLQPAKRRPGH